MTRCQLRVAHRLIIHGTAGNLVIPPFLQYLTLQQQQCSLRVLLPCTVAPNLMPGLSLSPVPLRNPALPPGELHPTRWEQVERFVRKSKLVPIRGRRSQVAVTERCGQTPASGIVSTEGDIEDRDARCHRWRHSKHSCEAKEDILKPCEICAGYRIPISYAGRMVAEVGRWVR